MSGHVADPRPKPKREISKLEERIIQLEQELKRAQESENLWIGWEDRNEIAKNINYAQCLERARASIAERKIDLTK